MKNNLITQNRKARHDYTVLKTYEAGIALKGGEIKSVRKHHINISDGFVKIRNGNAILENVHISSYEHGGLFGHLNPRRNRQLLLHKKEIRRLYRAVQKHGITIIPLKVYIKNGYAKTLIGIAKGKQKFDKRETEKKRAIKRKINNYMKR